MTEQQKLTGILITIGIAMVASFALGRGSVDLTPLCRQTSGTIYLQMVSVGPDGLVDESTRMSILSYPHVGPASGHAYPASVHLKRDVILSAVLVDQPTPLSERQ